MRRKPARTNSTLLEPLEGEQSDYVLVNHARWDGNLLLFMARQLPKKSFRSYMLANLKTRHLAAMPVLLPSGLACAAGAAGPGWLNRGRVLAWKAGPASSLPTSSGVFARRSLSARAGIGLLTCWRPAVFRGRG
jgi:hypothetical protein